jgi:hypothetical protein
LSAPDGVVLIDAPGPGLVELVDRRLGPKRKVLAVLLTSAGPGATADLAAIIRRHRCAVVAPKAGAHIVRLKCPDGTTLLNEDDRFQQGRFEMRTVPLIGRGVAPVAHVLRWAEKTVVVSGRIPQKLNNQALLDLMREVSQSEGGPKQFRRSLTELEKLSPDLWLPAIPVHGQNANVYDREWIDLLDRNAEMFP